MEDTRTLTIIDEHSPLDLAIAGWLDEHSKSAKTRAAYQDAIQQFRAALRSIGGGRDLDSDVRTLAMAAQAFASRTSNQEKDRAADSTFNLRLAILSSFYTYAMQRYLVAPMDDAGHILNPIKLVKRKKIEPYQGIHWLEPDEAEAALRKVDRSTPLGKRDYAILAILLQTGGRLKEVASLEWRHVHMKSQRVTLTFEHCKGDKTMRDTLNLANSKALLIWLHGHYGKDLNRLAKNAPLWVTLSRNTKQAGQPLVHRHQR